MIGKNRLCSREKDWGIEIVIITVELAVVKYEISFFFYKKLHLIKLMYTSTPENKPSRQELFMP